ncbi:Hypothetical predicted protein [Octopus vulgaris]|uniref:Uncharacterized protein n=1 Tax=Octopus vulgaris TaxID=6645 RepID=A0AA36BB47_OCTVU|nr:Hypothetical predicted protein [Octopus vulgaris]
MPQHRTFVCGIQAVGVVEKAIITKSAKKHIGSVSITMISPVISRLCNRRREERHLQFISRRCFVIDIAYHSIFMKVSDC